MKLDSKLFDRIRINPRHAAPQVQAEVPDCAWEGCDQPGLYKAPKGHRFEGEYHHFCLEHVRHYNTAFNFFADMSETERERHLYQTAETDGRPSWGLGSKPVWAIGTGLTPTRDDIAAMHKALRDRLVARFGTAGAAIRLLYGGSLKPANAREILAVPEVNGGLVGGASLLADDLFAIISAV